MKFPPAGKFTAWRERSRPFIRATTVLSVVVVMVTAALTALVLSGSASTPAQIAFGLLLGLGIATAFWLGWAVRAWYLVSKSRKDHQA